MTNNMHQIFDSFILRVIVLTEDFLNANPADIDNVENFTANRERLLSILDRLSLQIDWESVENQVRNESFKKIEYIKKLDEMVVLKLQEYQKQVKLEIEQTVKSKDLIKGYNLNEVK